MDLEVCAIVTCTSSITLLEKYRLFKLFILSKQKPQVLSISKSLEYLSSEGFVALDQIP